VTRPTYVDERGSFARVIDFEDTDRILIEIDHKRKSVRLRHVVPFHTWPQEPQLATEQVREQASKLLHEWLVGQTVYLDNIEVDGSGLKADVYRFTFGPSQVKERTWNGTLPAERFKWGGFNIAALLIQEGFSPYVVDELATPQGRENYQAAQRQAFEGKKGIWSDPKLAEGIKPSK
jgi:hypothetical protein